MWVRRQSRHRFKAMALKPIAISDTVTTCDCCGRTNLKKTIVLKDDNGAIRYHGTGCAAKAIHGYSDASVNNRIRKEALAAQTLEQQRKADVLRKSEDAQTALRLMDAGESLNHPEIQKQHAIWRNCTRNPFKPNPNLPAIGFRKWLEDRCCA